MMRVTKKLYALLIAGMMAVSLAGCQSTGNSSNGESTQNEQSSKGSTNSSTKSVSSDNIPDFSGNMTVAVDNNNPDFTSKDLTTKSYESYSRLDSEGRCQVAEACVGKDIMPKGKRGAIGMVKPTGWHTAKYNNVDGKYLYNRCHLIAYQLTGENANNKNLITGTRSFNVDGMLPYEEMVGDYVRRIFLLLFSDPEFPALSLPAFLLIPVCFLSLYCRFSYRSLISWFFSSTTCSFTREDKAVKRSLLSRNC